MIEAIYNLKKSVRETGILNKKIYIKLKIPFT